MSVPPLCYIGHNKTKDRINRGCFRSSTARGQPLTTVQLLQENCPAARIFEYTNCVPITSDAAEPMCLPTKLLICKVVAATESGSGQSASDRTKLPVWHKPIRAGSAKQGDRVRRRPATPHRSCPRQRYRAGLGGDRSQEQQLELIGNPVGQEVVDYPLVVLHDIIPTRRLSQSNWSKSGLLQQRVGRRMTSSR